MNSHNGNDNLVTQIKCMSKHILMFILIVNCFNMLNLPHNKFLLPYKI